MWCSRSLTWLTGQPFSLQREVSIFLTFAEPAAGQRWLDIGTSAGFYAGVLAARGCRVIATDLSPAMLREARRREASPNIDWRAMNGEELPFGAEFDGVTIGATLNETASPALMLREAARVLKVGGKLWLMLLTRTGGPLQRLGALAGLSFPERHWMEAQLPNCRLVHLQQHGAVLFVRFEKERP